MSRYLFPQWLWWLTACGLLAGCSDAEPPAGPPAGNTVVTSGKIDTSLDEVPAAALDAARQARPDLEFRSAEHELRDGREYYDLEGVLPDGSELELDLMRADGGWQVVEVQRDLELAQVAGPARQALAEAQPDWLPQRIIESDQGDGVVIYEFFGPGADGEERKVEVKWEDDVAEVLRDEWMH